MHQPCTDKSDLDLVKLSIQNSDWYFCLLKRYESKLLRYIASISGLRTEESEDILQEVFIKTYYHLNEYDPRLRFSSWIYRIAHNETISAIRKKKVRPQIFLEKDDFERLADEFDLVKEVDQKLTTDLITKIFNAMDLKYREALSLRFLDDKEYLEIADILQKPVSTVGNLIARGKRIFESEYRKFLQLTPYDL